MMTHEQVEMEAEWGGAYGVMGPVGTTKWGEQTVAIDGCTYEVFGAVSTDRGLVWVSVETETGPVQRPVVWDGTRWRWFTGTKGGA